MTPDTPAQTPPARIFVPALLAALGVAGMSAIWVIIALILDRQCAWMAVAAAIDIGLLLRVGRAAPGRGRAIATLAGTLATAFVANWTIAASEIGFPLGLTLGEALQRLGPHHAQTLLGLANRPTEWALYAIAAAVAWWWGR